MNIRSRPHRPPLRPYQAEIARAILRAAERPAAQTFVVEIARQGGKNETSAQLESLLIATHAATGGAIVKAAPTLQPQARVSLLRIGTTLRSLAIPYHASGYELSAREARITFVTAAPEANTVGLTASLLLEIDEAQDVGPTTYDTKLSPMRASTAAPAVFWGTSWHDTTLLEREKAHASKVFRVPWSDIAALVPAYGVHALKERDKLGADSLAWLTQYELRVVSQAGALLSSAQIAAIMTGKHARHEQPTAARYVGALDVAGDAATPESRPDAQVLTIAALTHDDAGNPVLEVAAMYELGNLREDITRDTVTTTARRWNLAHLVIDATGIGHNTALELRRRLGDSHVTPFKFTQESKSRIGFALISAASTGRLRMYATPDDERDELTRQLRAARRELLPNERIAWSVPDTAGHDDHLVSLALLTEAAELAGAPRLARGR